jgi:hypothetical protein
MPASWSLASRRSTGIPTVVASCLTVTSLLIDTSASYSCSDSANQGSRAFMIKLGGPILVHAIDFHQFVHRLLGQFVHRRDAARAKA